MPHRCVTLIKTGMKARKLTVAHRGERWENVDLLPTPMEPLPPRHDPPPHLLLTAVCADQYDGTALAAVLHEPSACGGTG